MARRQKLFLVLRIGASAVMLALLLSRVHISSLLPKDEAAAVPWLLAGLVVWLVAIVLATIRWQRVVTALELPAELPPLLSHSFAGMFVANFLPSTIGGDVLRVSRLTATNGQGPASFASVVLERLTGFLVLPMITLTALFLHPDLLQLGNASRIALLLSVGTLVALAGILLLAGNARLGRRLADNQSWLRFVGAVHLGFDRIRHHPGAVAGVILTAVAYQLTIVLAAWMATQALDINVGWEAVMAFIPVVAMAQVLPISVNGLGLREGALVLLLSPLGVATGQAVALGLLLYGMNLVISLLGAPAFAVGARPAIRATA
ncbi:MAG TPA: lysylphosphatidylglycerol synthase transmembrane domain-containing protein [Acidimicrobiales bacterium]|nr:lysylphosphatidylglycerol synthase transmembrane domain-containing protein [Acidimicrobiales bacterium]